MITADVLKETSELQINSAYSGIYPIRELREFPEDTLRKIVVDVNVLMNKLSNQGAVMFEVQSLNLCHEQLNPEHDNLFVRVIGFRKKPLN